MMDTAPRNQNDLTFSSNSYQGSSTPVATSNRHSSPLFGTNLSLSSQNFTHFQDDASKHSAGHQTPHVDQEVTMLSLAEDGIAGYNAKQNFT